MFALGFLLYGLLLPLVVPLVLQNLRGSRPLVFFVAVALFAVSVALVRLLTPKATARRIQENIARSCAVRVFCLGAFLLSLGLVLVALLHFHYVPELYFWLYVVPALAVFGLNALGIDLPRRSPGPSPGPEQPGPNEPDVPRPEIVGDYMLMTYNWTTRDGEPYRIDGFPIRRKVYEWTKRQQRVKEWEQWPREYVADAISGTSRQPAEVELRELSRRLYAVGKPYGSYEEVDFVLQFIGGGIEYQSDPGCNNPLASDYPRYPVETLGDAAGDCEDVALLGAAMLVSMGYKAALLLLPGHAMLGVAAEGLSGWHVDKDGVRYYLCEMTSNAWRMGYVPDDVNPRSVEMTIPVPSPAPKVVRSDDA